jgi:hypothetical protein
MANGRRISKDPGESLSVPGILEEKGREVLGSTHGGDLSVLPSSFVREDLSLLLHEIEQRRALEKGIEDSLLQQECHITTEMMQMESRTPRYSPYRFPEREKMQRRLDRLESERRRFRIVHAEKLACLHERLLTLLHKHRLLNPPD